MKNLILFLVLIWCVNMFAQDTLFSKRYPNGIVINDYEKTGQRIKFSPIENSSLVISLKLREVSEIKSPKGIKYKNENFSNNVTNRVVLNIEPRTGKIHYSNVISIENKSKKEAFENLRKLPNRSVTYELLSEDTENYSFQKFRGKFKANFAGDKFNIFFNLEIDFKDAKIRYIYTDFYIDDIYTKSSVMNIYGLGLGKMRTIDNSHALDKRYSNGDWNTDQKYFWIPIEKSINESIKTIEETAIKNNDW